MADAILSRDAQLTLEWLSKEDFSLYGECKGAALMELTHAGYAEVGAIPPGRTDPNYRLVSVTEKGIAALRAALSDRPQAEGDAT